MNINYSFQIGVWYSFAVVRQSGTINFFINGVQQTTQNAGVIGGYSFPAEGTTFIGRGWSTPEYFTGYISNVRTTNGTALYTANYTPATAPLSPISGTTILSCQSNRFIDNSSNGFTLTANGSPSVQRFSPFNPTAPYSTSVIGGSGYFDGSGANLTFASNAALHTLLATLLLNFGYIYTILQMRETIGCMMQEHLLGLLVFK